ncbi:MAG: flagellar basal body L-ring protein FlgH [Arcobacteraceae bacterium]
MMHKLSLFIASIFVFIGCANNTEKINKSVIIDEKPKYQVEKVVKVPVQNAKGSLFSNQGGSLFADKRNLQIGDIVFIIIKEGATATTFSEKIMENNLANNDRNYKGGAITTTDDTPSFLTSAADKLNGILGISAALPRLDRDVDFTSESTALDNLDYDISAVVSQLYQNGNYFIEGTKEVAINGQKQTLKLSGVLRPYDIDNNNQVNADKLANLKVVYSKNGDEMDFMEKPWGTKLIDTIWPF